MLQMRLPEHLVSLDDKVHAVQDIMNHVDTEVVVLVGMGGIGKTTLAKAVYESERSRNNFDEIAWVTMGRDPNILQCLQQIWAQLVSSERNPSCSNMEDLKSEHLSTLKKKCVLLVLDDVWSVNSLEKLKITVSNGDSRLLVTSRDMKVARGVGAKVYDVGLLDKNSSLELFCKCAFGMPGIPDEKVKYRPFVEQMVMQCAQLPLALQVVGSLAREFRQLAEWEAGVSRLQQSRSLGAVYEDDLLSVLRISYEDLDDFQKAFFFCLVCYPEDSHVKVSDLVEQWVACLDVEADSDVEDCFLDGYTICLQLMDRSLFMYDAVPESAGDADMMNNTSCYLHDFLREVGLRLASKDRPLAAREKLLFPNLHQLRDKTVMARHLSTCGDASNCWPEGFEAPSMVSLISRDSGLTALPSKLVLSPHLRILDLSRSAIGEISPSIREISLLQVLRLDGCNGVSMLPKELTDLSHLTVLSLRDCPGLQSLPESLGNLTRLHSLFIGCHKLQHLPASIVNATRMRRLDLSGCEILMSLPDGLGQFSYLQVLSLAGCKDITSIPQSLGFITGLQVLCLSWCRGITVLPNEIGLLSHLQTLDLSECRGLTRLPESVTQLCELQTLNLNGCWSLTWIPDLELV
ncbi:unnamed protein product [Ostreobium quekettii]|uniref:NB-ARC domain-containing protein n=1 Tax=Ostreobium quekettii TaxID=121088 RepID=A0A8S1JGP2_9CHLO|nr:unnamed protein product [Ostreobium quekettii]